MNTNPFSRIMHYALRLIFSALLCVLSVSAFGQTPVTLSTVNIYGAAPTATVTFTPAQQIGVSYPNYVLGGPIMVAATNGAVNTNLLEGPYVISFSGYTASRRVYVPGLWITNCGYSLPVSLAAPQWQLPPGIDQIVLTNFTGSIAALVLTNAPANAIIGGTLLLNTNYDAAGAAAAAQAASDTNGAANWALSQAELYGNNNYVPANGGTASNLTLNGSANLNGTSITNWWQITPARATNASIATNAPDGIPLNSLMTTNNAGTLYQDTNALAFANRNGISSIQVRNQLVTMQNILNQYGVSTNIVDVIFFHKTFNPSNNLTYFGRGITSSNLVWQDSFGAYFTNGAFAQVDNLPWDFRTGCVMAVFCRPDNIRDGNMDAFCGFYNTNTLSGNWSLGAPSETHIGSREGTNLVNSVLNGAFATETNLVYSPNWSGSFTFDPSGNGFSQALKQLWTYSWSGSNSTVWQRGVQGKINYYNQQYTLGQQFPPQEPLTTFKIGGDVMTNNTTCITPWSGDVQCVFLCNCAANSNLVKALNLAAWAICPETKTVTFVSHSRGIWNGTGSWADETNSYQHYIVPQWEQIPYSYENWPISGASIFGAWGNTFSNFLFNLGPYPPNVQRVIVENFGVNDIYVGGYTITGPLGAISSMGYAAHTNGCLFVPMTDYGAGTNGFVVVYSSANNAMVWNLDLAIETNAWQWDGIYDMARLANFGVLSTNSGTNGITIDGYHVQKANASWQFNSQVPSAFVRGVPNLLSDFNGNVPTNSKTQPW